MKRPREIDRWPAFGFVIFDASLPSGGAVAIATTAEVARCAARTQDRYDYCTARAWISGVAAGTTKRQASG